MSKPRVCLIQGGMGAERDVSLSTGQGFEGALKELGYEYHVIDAKEDLPVQLGQLRPKVDVALLALHGKYAEDGIVQSLCEYLKLPYTGCGILASSLCMDKVFSKQIYEQNGIPTAKYEVLDTRSKPVSEFTPKLKVPFVVKPSREGSSVGITIVKEEGQIKGALEEAAKYDHFILIEEYIAGMELTVPVINDKALTTIEIAPKEGFYNYENKYTKGKTDYIMPARLSDKTNKKAQEIAVQTFQVCRMRGYARVDFRVAENGQDLFVMEANTLPGCTPTSLVPMAALHEDIEFPQLIEIFIQTAGLDYEGVR